MLALRRFHNKLVRSTVPALSSTDSQNVTTAYEQKELRPIGLITQRQTGGHLLLEAGQVKTIPFPHGYDNETRLMVVMRVENTVKVALFGADGPSNVLIKGVSGQKGRYCVTDVFDMIQVINPTADIAQIQYAMFEIPDLTLASSFYGMVSPIIPPTDSGGGGSIVATSCCSRAYVASSRLDYLVTPVTTGAWQQLISSTGGAATRLTVFDSSGQTVEIGFGASGSESRVLLVSPGGLDESLTIPAGTRVSVRAVSATADVGEIDINILA